MSVQSQLVSFIQKQRNTGLFFKKFVFLLQVLDNLRKYYQFWVLDTFWKSQKLIPSKKNQSVLFAKSTSHRTKKKPVRKIILPQKFRATRYHIFVVVTNKSLSPVRSGQKTLTHNKIWQIFLRKRSCSHYVNSINFQCFVYSRITQVTWQKSEVSHHRNKKM